MEIILFLQTLVTTERQKICTTGFTLEDSVAIFYVNSVENVQ